MSFCSFRKWMHRQQRPFLSPWGRWLRWFHLGQRIDMHVWGHRIMNLRVHWVFWVDSVWSFRRIRRWVWGLSGWMLGCVCMMTMMMLWRRVCGDEHKVWKWKVEESTWFLELVSFEWWVGNECIYWLKLYRWGVLCFVRCDAWCVMWMRSRFEDEREGFSFLIRSSLRYEL